MKDLVLQTPVEVKNESGIYLTLQLSKTTITDNKGEREAAPEIVLVCQKHKDSIKHIGLALNINQANELIKHLEGLISKAKNIQRMRYETN